MLEIHFFGLQRKTEFHELLNFVGFSQQLAFLKNKALIAKKTFGEINKLIGVRNQFAHQWDTNEITYDGVRISESENFAKFKKVSLDTFLELGKSYKELLAANNLDAYLNSAIQTLNNVAKPA